jgi:hypothetical protein
MRSWRLGITFKSRISARWVTLYRRDRIVKRHRLRLQIVSLQDVDNLGDLDIGQKRALLCRELERTLGRTRNTANILLCEPTIFTLHCHN